MANTGSLAAIDEHVLVSSSGSHGGIAEIGIHVLAAPLAEGRVAQIGLHTLVFEPNPEGRTAEISEHVLVTSTQGRDRGRLGITSLHYAIGASGSRGRAGHVSLHALYLFRVAWEAPPRFQGHRLTANRMQGSRLKR